MVPSVRRLRMNAGATEMSDGRDSSTLFAKDFSSKIVPQISIADFREVNSMKDRANTTLFLRLEQLVNNVPLSIKDLREIPEESTQYMLAECFAKKGALEQYCTGYTAEDFLKYIKRVWPRLQDMSFGVVDPKGVVMGVATMGDEMDLSDLSELASNGIHPHLTNIYGYLGSLVDRVKDRVPQTVGRGVMMDKFLYGVRLNAMSSSENLYVMYLLMKETHRRAEERGFAYSISQNTHPFTQELAQFFGSERLLTDCPHNYTNHAGEKVFSFIPEKVKVTVDFITYPRKP